MVGKANDHFQSYLSKFKSLTLVKTYFKIFRILHNNFNLKLNIHTFFVQRLLRQVLEFKWSVLKRSSRQDYRSKSELERWNPSLFRWIWVEKLLGLLARQSLANKTYWLHGCRRKCHNEILNDQNQFEEIKNDSDWSERNQTKCAKKNSFGNQKRHQH